MAPISTNTGVATNAIISFMVGASVTACLVLAVICTRLIITLNRKHKTSKHTNVQPGRFPSRVQRPPRSPPFNVPAAAAPATQSAKERGRVVTDTQSRWPDRFPDTTPLYEKIRLHKMKAPHQRTRLVPMRTENLSKRSLWSRTLKRRSSSSFASFDVLGLSRSASARLAGPFPNTSTSGPIASSVPPIPTSSPSIQSHQHASSPLGQIYRSDTLHRPEPQPQELPADQDIHPVLRPSASSYSPLNGHLRDQESWMSPRSTDHQRTHAVDVLLPHSTQPTDPRGYSTVPLQYVRPRPSTNPDENNVHRPKSPKETAYIKVEQHSPSGHLRNQAHYRPSNDKCTTSTKMPVYHTTKQHEKTAQLSTTSHSPEPIQIHHQGQHGTSSSDRKGKGVQRAPGSTLPANPDSFKTGPKDRTASRVGWPLEIFPIDETRTTTTLHPSEGLTRPSLVTSLPINPTPGLADSPYETPVSSPTPQTSEPQNFMSPISPPPAKPLPAVPRNRTYDPSWQTRSPDNAHASQGRANIFSLESAYNTQQFPTRLSSTRLGMRAASSDVLRSRASNASSLHRERTYSGNLQYII